ncbi:MAG: hypothetical protein WD360_05800 [Nitriliruptoraceae bacterium]
MTELWNDIVDVFESMAVTVAEWIPRILLALVVLVVGRLILGLIRRLIVKLLELSAVRTVFSRAGLTSATEPSGRSPAQLVAGVIYAVLLVALFILVFDILQLDVIVELLQAFLEWIPIVILAAVIVIIAAAVASWVSDLIAPYAQARGVAWLSSVVRVGVIAFGVLAALDVLNITFAEDLVKIVIAGAAVALAVAFGVGGIDTAKQWWARYLAPSARSVAPGSSSTNAPEQH